MIILSRVKAHWAQLLFYLLLVTGLIGLDQTSKFWIQTHFVIGQSREFLPGLIRLTYLQNRGAAFSILQDQQGLFALVTLLVIAFVGYYLLTHLNKPWWWALGLLLIIAGGLGNLIDRLAQGYVVDMIELEFVQFAIFNVADSCLTLGVALSFITLWKEESGNKNNR